MSDVSVLDLAPDVRGMVREKVVPLVSPHPLAPFASKATGEEVQEVLDLVLKEIKGKDAEELGEEIVLLIREFSLVSLYFFLKVIAAYSGPFDKLNDDLHLEMCNFRQGLLREGARGGMFIPRSHYKSTIVTEGATAWEMERNPDIRILIAGATADKSQSFMMTVKAIFDSNALTKRCFPEYIPEGARPPRWNDTELVLPNRTRFYREATVECIGSGGASEGHHYNLILCDDLIGLKALNSQRTSAAEMVRTKNWFWGSEKTLLINVKEDRVIVVGTRYAADDLYQDILEKAWKLTGCPLPNWVENPKGAWEIYYRMCIEDGKVIFPENWTLEAYEEMKKDDYFTFMSQFMNYPQGAGLAEFADLSLNKCMVEWNKSGECEVVLPRGGELERISLNVCNVVIAADPAASEKYVSAKTSRSAVGVIAVDPGGRRFILELRVGYVTVSTLFEWLFVLHKRYGRWRPRTLLEQQGAFRILGPLLEEKQRREGYWVLLDKVSCPGDKDARIRSALEPLLKRGMLYCVEAFYGEVDFEKANFPQSTKKDVLDMIQIGVLGGHVPAGGGKVGSRERVRDVNKYTGY